MESIWSLRRLRGEFHSRSVRRGLGGGRLRGESSATGAPAPRRAPAATPPPSKRRRPSLRRTSGFSRALEEGFEVDVIATYRRTNGRTGSRSACSRRMRTRVVSAACTSRRKRTRRRRAFARTLELANNEALSGKIWTWAWSAWCPMIARMSTCSSFAWTRSS